MSIRQINQSHRYSNVKYIVKSHNMFGIYHRMRFNVFGQKKLFFLAQFLISYYLCREEQFS